MISPLLRLISLGALYVATVVGAGAAEPTSLGDFSSEKIAALVAAPKGTAKPGAKGLDITFSEPAGGQITFSPAADLSAWKNAGALGLEVQNTGSQAIKLIVHLGAFTGFRSVGAGDTMKLALPLGDAVRVRGMKVPPPFEGWGKFQGTSGRLDLSKPPSVVLELQSPAPISLRWAQAALLPPVDTAGMVDKFGQYSRREWPGKVHDEAGLRAEDPPITVAKGPALDQYGGWKEGPKMNATGWFHPEKAGGRWWLVTPEGHAFFSLGADAAAPTSSTTVKGREKWFAALPPDHADAVDFHQANLIRKFGPEWKRRWTENTLSRLNRWGFNTLGAWSDESLFPSRRTAYTVILHVDGDFHRISPIGGGGKKTVPDPFDSRLSAAIAATFAKQAAHLIDDPWLLGYFVGNEFPFGTWTGPLRHSVVLGVLGAGSSPAKIALVDHLRAAYETPEKLATRWNVAVASWESLLASPLRVPKKWTPALEEDLQSLSAFFAQRYYQTVRETLRKADPHHMYLGSRFAGSTPEFVSAAAKYCDVTSFNIYRGKLRAEDPVMKHFAQLDRPAMVTEFHFGASDRGLFGTGLAWTANQDARGAAYQAYLDSVRALPFMVGTHWFQYVDQPVSGRAGDGENYGIGLVSIVDKPYTELLTRAAAANFQIYHQP